MKLELDRDGCGYDQNIADQAKTAVPVAAAVQGPCRQCTTRHRTRHKNRPPAHKRPRRHFVIRQLSNDGLTPVRKTRASTSTNSQTLLIWPHSSFSFFKQVLQACEPDRSRGAAAGDQNSLYRRQGGRPGAGPGPPIGPWRGCPRVTQRHRQSHVT